MKERVQLKQNAKSFLGSLKGKPFHNMQHTKANFSVKISSAAPPWGTLKDTLLRARDRRKRPEKAQHPEGFEVMTS